MVDGFMLGKRIECFRSIPNQPAIRFLQEELYTGGDIKN